MFMCIELPLKEYLQKRFELSMSVPHNFGIEWLDGRMLTLGYHLELHMDQDVHIHINKNAYKGFVKNLDEELLIGMLNKPLDLHQDVVTFILTEQTSQRLERVTRFSNRFYDLLMDYHTGDEPLMNVEIVSEGSSPEVLFSN